MERLLVAVLFILCVTLWGEGGRGGVVDKLNLLSGQQINFSRPFVGQFVGLWGKTREMTKYQTGPQIANCFAARFKLPSFCSVRMLQLCLHPSLSLSLSLCLSLSLHWCTCNVVMLWSCDQSLPLCAASLQLDNSTAVRLCNISVHLQPFSLCTFKLWTEKAEFKTPLSAVNISFNTCLVLSCVVLTFPHGPSFIFNSKIGIITALTQLKALVFNSNNNNNNNNNNNK
jgi:hypothetical protein